MIFGFLAFLLGYCLGLNLMKTSQRLGNWFQRYKQLKDWTNNKKQKKLCALFGCILKTVFVSSDSFCFITSHIVILVSAQGTKVIWHWPLFFRIKNSRTCSCTSSFLLTSYVLVSYDSSAQTTAVGVPYSCCMDGTPACSNLSGTASLWDLPIGGIGMCM